MPFLSHLQGFGWMLGGTPWDMVKGAWPAPSPPLGWPFKSCQMKSSGDCCFPSLSLSSILLSSPPQHPRLFSPPQLPTHSLLTLTLTHAQDPRSSSLPPLVVPINSGCGTPALRHSDPIRSGPSSPLRISCEWAGLPVRERVRKERRAVSMIPFSAPLSWASASSEREWPAAQRQTPLSWKFRTRSFETFHSTPRRVSCSHAQPPPCCARPPSAQTRALSGLPGVPPSIISRPERKCWCYTMLIKFTSMHSSQRQSGVIKGGTD